MLFCLPLGCLWLGNLLAGDGKRWLRVSSFFIGDHIRAGRTSGGPSGPSCENIHPDLWQIIHQKKCGTPWHWLIYHSFTPTVLGGRK